ncbi:MAG: type I-MYXAN CRISPR-associated protein Cas6/Cmx6 [Candidatus Dojkabacteria bacterium]|nr:type I-MYXAN CRISPR-associated protein Cas6/Cmx6 [Candidatus Dojkabacteria bacterium]
MTEQLPIEQQQEKLPLFVRYKFKIVYATGSLPIDHAHYLYGSIKSIAPEFEHLENVGIFRICGSKIPNSFHFRIIPNKSSISIRCPAEYVNSVLKLRNNSFRIGKNFVYVRHPQVFVEKPIQHAYSPMVVIHKLDRWANPDEIQHDIQKLYPNSEVHVIPQKKTLKIHNNIVIGYPVIIKNLNEEESLKLQFFGVGGRRKFGCGIFVKYEGFV